MYLEQIRCFTVVARELNVSRAAERLHVSQPALSRRVQALEDRLGVALIVRHGRGIRLTRAAEELLPHLAEFVLRADNIRDIARSLAGDPHRVIRVGATAHFIATLLSKALGPFVKRYPRLEIVLVEAPSEDFQALLEHNEIHLAVGARRFGKPFHMRPLPPIPLLAIFPPGHPLKSRGSVEIGEMADQPLLLLRRGYLTREVFESACQLAHLAPSVKHESDSLQTIVSLSRAGYGVGVVPGNALIRGRFASLLQHGRQITLDVAAAWNPEAHLPQEIDELIDALADTMRREVAGMQRNVT